MKRALLVVAALVLHAAAHAQIILQPVPTTGIAPVVEVQRLAPQLVAFAGGDANFVSLVNGLALGVPVTLSTPLATGGSQVVSFTPTGTMNAVQIAQVLESARQSLISRGIAAPTAQQLSTTLVGGSLTTNLGSTPVNGFISATTPGTTLTQSPATAIQGAAAPNAASGGTARNMSDSPFPRGISDTPPLPVPGVTAPVQTAPAAVAPTPPAAVAPTSPAITVPRGGIR